MRDLLRVWFLIVLVLLAGVAEAQPSGPAVLGRRVAQHVMPLDLEARTWSIDDLDDMYGSNTAKQMAESSKKLRIPVPDGGRFIKWSGGFMLAGELVYGAMEWCANNNTCSGAVRGFLYSKPGSLDLLPESVVINGKNVFKTSECSGNMEVYGGSYSMAYYVEPYNAEKGNGIYTYVRLTAKSDGVERFESNFWNEARADYVAQCYGAPSASTFSTLAPQTKEEIADAVRRYIEDNPSRVRPYLEPAPNANQWADDPYADPALDTDGDGWTDAAEYERGTDPNSNLSKPKTATTTLDTDGDGWTDEEERAKGTDPRNPKSYPLPIRPSPTSDTDGDGWTDEEERAKGTDPYNPSSKPSGEPGTQPTPKPEPQPELECKSGEVLRYGKCVPEETEVKCPIGQVKNPVTGRCERERDDSERADPSEFPPLEPPDEFDPTDLHAHWEEVLSKVREAAKDKFPFGIGDKWFPDDSGGSNLCQSYSVEVGELDIASAPCSTDAANFGRDVVRPALVWLLFAVTGLTATRVALQ
ncbi:hypothetical protein [Deinococcus sp. SL84]|uniref:hypothetical protein n=1 Tax=Deinococcus sp. SL84 TaxID=2994663 RepID=UPI0022729EA0|nr:hypothetical protein [Deinococcus sp. SL84]MCY1703444.1 hypothetical protein [Deinococcus sp. SL84]